MIWAENHSYRTTLYSSVQIGTGRKQHDFIDQHSQLFFETANAARIRHLEENGGFAERMCKLRKQNQITGIRQPRPLPQPIRNHSQSTAALSFRQRLFF